MSDAFFTMNGNVRAIGSIRRGANGQPQSLEGSIPDGDTAGIHIEGSGSVRFLGVDTPEKNFSLAGSSAQRRLDSSEWEAYLTDPFLPQFGPFHLDTDLATHLRARVGTGAGINHRVHGDNAERALIGLIQADMAALAQTPGTFGYFLSFSFEVFDSFGRFLAFINRNQPNGNSSGPRPPTYNERMLEQGASCRSSYGRISIRSANPHRFSMRSSCPAPRGRSPRPLQGCATRERWFDKLARTESASSTHPTLFASRHSRCAISGDGKPPIVRSSI